MYSVHRAAESRERHQKSAEQRHNADFLRIGETTESVEFNDPISTFEQTQQSRPHASEQVEQHRLLTITNPHPNERRRRRLKRHIGKIFIFRYQDRLSFGRVVPELRVRCIAHPDVNHVYGGAGVLTLDEPRKRWRQLIID